MTLFKKALIILPVFFLIGCNGFNEKPKTAEQLKFELKTKEVNSPLIYLSNKNVTLKPLQKKVRNAGLFRDAEYSDDGALIQGNIINKATLAKYKDLRFTLSFYSRTETLIDEQSYVLYDYYEPNSTKPFKVRIESLPKAYVNFSFRITGATGLYK